MTAAWAAAAGLALYGAAGMLRAVSKYAARRGYGRLSNVLLLLAATCVLGWAFAHRFPAWRLAGAIGIVGVMGPVVTVSVICAATGSTWAQVTARIDAANRGDR